MPHLVPVELSQIQHWRQNSLVWVDDGDGVVLEHPDGVVAVAKVLAALAQHGHPVRHGGELGGGVARVHLGVVGEEDDLEAAAEGDDSVGFNTCGLTS